MSETRVVVTFVVDMEPTALHDALARSSTDNPMDDVADALWLHLNPMVEGRRHAPHVDVDIEGWSVKP